MNSYAQEQAQRILPMQIPLLQLRLYLSDGCTLGCRGCIRPAAGSSGKAPHFLSFETLAQAVCEAQPLGLRSIHLSGAHLLQHPQLDKLLDFLQPLGLNFILEANGGQVSPGLALRLSRTASLTVLVGLDGVDAATHDSLHGAPGLFEQSMTNLTALSAAGTAPEIVFSLHRRNAGQVPGMVRLAETIGASALNFNLPLPQFDPAGASNPDLLQVPELIALGRRIERDLAIQTRVRLIYGAPPAFRGLHPQARIQGSGRLQPLNIVSVLASGEYALCGAGQSVPELVLGKTGTDPLAEIWKDHPLLQTLRDGMPQQLGGICEHCIMKSACMGNCAVENYLRTGSLWSPHWFCETAAQAGLFPAGRVIENIV